MKKVLLITHNDLDGVSCEILAKLAFQDGKLEVIQCKNPADASENIMKLFDKLHEYDHIFITDISVTDEVADKIKDFNVVLLDHHKISDRLRSHKWVYNMTDTSVCGTIMFLRYLLVHHYDSILDSDSVKKYCEYVRMYDTFTFGSDNNPLYLNDLFRFYGNKEFSFTWTTRFKDSLILHPKVTIFHNHEWRIISCLKDNKARYLDARSYEFENPKLHDIQGLKAIVLYANQHVSELGNRLASEHPEADFIVLIDMERKAVSLRTVKDNIDCSKIAKKYGGGGHQKAAGFSFEDNGVLIDMIFNRS